MGSAWCRQAVPNEGCQSPHEKWVSKVDLVMRRLGVVLMQIFGAETKRHQLTHQTLIYGLQVRSDQIYWDFVSKLYKKNTLEVS